MIIIIIMTIIVIVMIIITDLVIGDHGHEFVSECDVSTL